jgi:LPS-assembly protein
MIAPLHRRAAASLALLFATAGVRAAEPLCVPGLLAAAPDPSAPAAGVASDAPTPFTIPDVQALPGLDGLTGALMPGSKAGIDWSSNSWSTDAATGNTELDGDVSVRFGERELRSDRLSYLAAAQELRLDGTVRYTDPTLALSGDAGHYRNGQADFENAQFELRQAPGRGSASRITLLTPQKVELDDVAYTTCAPGTADWQLRARRITLDLKSLRGLGRDTRVIFKGVTIFYLPVLSFPISNARQTGFLFPTLGSSSQGGAMVAVPWYWNIAANQDLLLTPKIYTRRGLDLGAEYRLLERAGTGSLAFNFLPSDRVAHNDRSWERLLVDAHLPGNWRAQVHAENVSDLHYLEDFSEGPLTTSTVFLPRQLELGLRSDRLRLGAEVLQFQTLDSQMLHADRPYAALPRLTGSGLFPTSSGIVASYEAELVNFWRPLAVATAMEPGPDNTKGWRGHVQPAISYDYTRPGYYLRPRAALDLTSYRLRDNGTAPDTFDRSLPILSLDGGMQFERSDSQRVITLEPRLYYVYIPYRDQSQLPTFDSDLQDPNIVSLFRANRYAGLDRIGEANNLTFGLTTHMLASSTGQRYLSATIGQTLHFDSACRTVAKTAQDPDGVAGCVRLPLEGIDTRRRSDLILNVDLTAYRNWSLRYDLAWNPGTSQTEKSLLALQYRPAGDRVLNLGYRYTRGSSTTSGASSSWVDQAEASIAWPLARRWDLYARSVYALGNSATYPILDPQTGLQRINPQTGLPEVGVVRSLENFVGFQYRGSCWGLRVVARDAVSRTGGDRDRGWFLQLELNGLSSVGSGADSFLRGSIRGYSPATSNR